MTYILGFDFETDGLDPLACNPVEIGAVVVSLDDIRNKKFLPIAIMDRLITLPEGKTVPENITQLTTINDAHLQQFGVRSQTAMQEFAGLLTDCSIVVSHNGHKFDQVILERLFGTLGLGKIQGKIWVDTLVDLPYPANCTSKRLPHLAADHGIFLAHGHRAIFDVMAMLELLTHYDINQVVAMAESPFTVAVAHVQFKDKDLAKARGFEWKDQLWVKTMRFARLEIESKEWPFSYHTILV